MPVPFFYPMDRRSVFADKNLKERWPPLEKWLIRDPETWRDLAPGRPFLKRVEYNNRRNKQLVITSSRGSQCLVMIHY